MNKDKQLLLSNIEKMTDTQKRNDFINSCFNNFIQAYNPGIPNHLKITLATVPNESHGKNGAKVVHYNNITMQRHEYFGEGGTKSEAVVKAKLNFIIDTNLPVPNSIKRNKNSKFIFINPDVVETETKDQDGLLNVNINDQKEIVSIIEILGQFYSKVRDIFEKGYRFFKFMHESIEGGKKYIFTIVYDNIEKNIFKYFHGVGNTPRNAKIGAYLKFLLSDGLIYPSDINREMITNCFKDCQRLNIIDKIDDDDLEGNVAPSSGYLWDTLRFKLLRSYSDKPKCDLNYTVIGVEEIGFDKKDELWVKTNWKMHEIKGVPPDYYASTFVHIADMLTQKKIMDPNSPNCKLLIYNLLKSKKKELVDVIKYLNEENFDYIPTDEEDLNEEEPTEDLNSKKSKNKRKKQKVC